MIWFGMIHPLIKRLEDAVNALVYESEESIIKGFHYEDRRKRIAVLEYQNSVKVIAEWIERHDTASSG